MSNVKLIFDVFYDIFTALYYGGEMLFYWLSSPIVETDDTSGMLTFFEGKTPIEFLFSGVVIAVLTWWMVKWVVS